MDECVVIFHAITAPASVTVAGNSLKCIGITGSVRIGKDSQLIIDPANTALVVRISTGVVMLLSSFVVWWREVEFDGHQAAEIMKRIEYAAVAPVARKNIRINTGLYGLNKDVSRIMSFE